ncbi:SGNH hydrolase-type esterase domain-containing protein [Xylariomycetidae sp. FL2044]|nr:SGNH hydrolase-type esterase domain-containing protein [Xylariomycetidae sp. FL2044]
MAWDQLEKGEKTSSRFSWLRTKRAIAAGAILVVALIIVIVLAATGVFSAAANSDDGSSSGAAQDAKGGSATTSSSSSTTGSSSTQPTGTSTITPTTPTGLFPAALATTSAEANHPAATSLSPDTPLRIMALGASIVKGETSPGTVGFRKPMRDELTGLGFAVNMVGSVQLGDMVDNEVEAYGGKKIKEMHEYAKKAVPDLQPNVVVINLGTNNILQNIDVDIAGEDMGNMIDYLLTASNQSTVILSTLLTNTVPNCEPMVLDINTQYRDMMKGLEADGKPVLLAEMHPSEGIEGVPQVEDIGPDGTHPTENGYAIMGHLFTEAIQEAGEKGLLRQPVDNGIPDDGAAETSR